ncbi:hypothetical protein A2U01_0056168 [Trifolium medium]|uniref:Uncharacterized protein n=1 Tax=Trifolium medium TaxID=97028 RepID=A0A392RFF2_9FABA|nr:hypothetical protein [Trifolium medium]
MVENHQGELNPRPQPSGRAPQPTEGFHSNPSPARWPSGQTAAPP